MTQPISAQRVLKGTYAQRVEREKKLRRNRFLRAASDGIADAWALICNPWLWAFAAAFATWAILGRTI